MNIFDAILAGWTGLKTTLTAPADATRTIAEQYGTWISITVLLVSIALYIASYFHTGLARKLNGHWLEMFAAVTALVFVIAVVADHNAITTYGSLATFLICLVLAAIHHTSPNQARAGHRSAGDLLRNTVYLPTAIGLAIGGTVCVLSVGVANALIAGAIAVVVLLVLLGIRVLWVANTKVDQIFDDELDPDDDPDPFATQLRIERRDPTDTTGETR